MRRLDLVKSVITSGHTLAETAVMSGFADQSHMTRQFKQAFGLTPGRWQAICTAAYNLGQHTENQPKQD
jgi:AraC-like DNA-binding protein